MYSSEKYFLCIKSLCPGPGHFLSSASACIMCEWNLLTWPRLNTKLSTINHQMYKEDKTCVQLHLFDQIYDTDNTHCARLLVSSNSWGGWIHLNSKNVFAQLPKMTICLHKLNRKTLSTSWHDQWKVGKLPVLCSWFQLMSCKDRLFLTVSPTPRSRLSKA